ncbi:hypothetical protein [Ekhidna sp.]
MIEFKTIIFKKDDEHPKDNRFIQMVLLLAIAFLVLYIFESSPTRNIILFVIVAWGFLLHFSHYIFKKENVNGSFNNMLVIGNEGIIIDEKTFDYNIIEQIDIYIDGYENQYKASYHELIQNGGLNNKITISSNGQTYSELFRLASKNHTYDLIHTLNGLHSSVREKVSLVKNLDRINF